MATKTLIATRIKKIRGGTQAFKAARIVPTRTAQAKQISTKKGLQAANRSQITQARTAARLKSRKPAKRIYRARVSTLEKRKQLTEALIRSGSIQRTNNEAFINQFIPKNRNSLDYFYNKLITTGKANPKLMKEYTDFVKKRSIRAGDFLIDGETQEAIQQFASGAAQYVHTVQKNTKPNKAEKKVLWDEFNESVAEATLDYLN